MQQEAGVNCMPRLDEQLNDIITSTAINDQPLDPFEDVANEVVQLLPFCSDDEDENELDIRSETIIVSENVNCRPRPPCSDDTVSQYIGKTSKGFEQ